jgi:mlo protein
MVEEGRSLAETPTWSVATVTTLMVAACFLVERGISRFAKWLRKTKRKAMLAALEKIREELMLLGVISLLLSQTARWISEICVPSSLFTSRFYICSETDYEDLVVGGKRSTMEMNQTVVPNGLFGIQSQNVCSEGHEPFVSYEGLEQLHRFLFILGITHVLYTFVTVVLSMIKVGVLIIGQTSWHMFVC